MKKFINNDYALNKHSDAIVYIFADGVNELTLADFLTMNPGATNEDFAKLKVFSDEDYLRRDRDGYNQTYKNVNIEWAEQVGKCSGKSPEEAIIDAIEAQEVLERRNRRIALAKSALNTLTNTQRRRYLMHVVHSLTTREIAALEGVAQQVVDRSILAAKKKIKKILSEN